MNTTARPSGRVHQEILYAHQVWKWQRFYAALLVVLGLFSFVVFRNRLGQVGQDVTNAFQLGKWNVLFSFDIWLLYLPLGLLLGGGIVLWMKRSYVEPMDDGLKISTLRSSVMIDYADIRGVRVQPLNLAYLDDRKRMVVGNVRGLLEKPALFIRLKIDDGEGTAMRKTLGRRIMYDDTIALPINDADAVAWEINAHLPERVGQNQGGARRRKKRR